MTNLVNNEEEMSTLSTTESTLPTLRSGETWDSLFASTLTAFEAEQAEREAAAKRVEAAAERGARAAVVAGEDALMDAGEVAAMLNVTEDRVWSLTREGKLPSVKLGRRTYRYRRAAVLAAVEEMEGRR